MNKNTIIGIVTVIALVITGYLASTVANLKARIVTLEASQTDPIDKKLREQYGDDYMQQVIAQIGANIKSIDIVAKQVNENVQNIGQLGEQVRAALQRSE